TTDFFCNDTLSAHYIYNCKVDATGRTGTRANRACFHLASESPTDIQFSDNQIRDPRAEPSLLRCSFDDFAAAVTAGAIVDGNKYWTPNATDALAIYNTDDSTFYSIEDFHTAVGATVFTEEDPGWTDPANGDFSTDSEPGGGGGGRGRPGGRPSQ